MPRKKKIAEPYTVDPSDCIPFSDKPEESIYFKYVSVQKLMPVDLGLDKIWKRGIELPNTLMKKIYLKDVYTDDEIEIIEPEPIEDYRREFLNDYLRYRDFPPVTDEQVWLNRPKPPEDNLLKELERAAKRDRESQEKRKGDRNLRLRLDRNRSDELNSHNIAICRKHSIQPERNIAKIAIAKMNDLSEEEERKFRCLLLEKDFMDALHGEIEKYFKNLPPS